MEWLDDEGFDAFVGLGIEPAGLLTASHVVFERLETLAKLVKPGSFHHEVVRNYFYRIDETGYASTRRRHHAWEEEPWESSESIHGEELEIECVRGVESERVGRPAKNGIPLDNEPTIMQLVISGAGLSRVWTFHKTDADPYPSVPHGHDGPGHNARSYPKLDPYRGLIIDKAKLVTKERRKAIIALWNQPEFREFAHQAVSFKLEEDPTFRSRLLSDRGVRYPLRFPY